MLELYEFKRSYPRVEINSPISLLFDSREAEAIAHDISFEGLRILCDQKTARLMEDSENTSSLEVTFKLPFEDREEAIKARCAIMYMLKLIDDTLAMGVRITDIDEDKQNDLRRFIENSLEPM